MHAREQIANWLQTAQRAIAFTGAGISTESGIPDFRSPGGVWARNQPVYFDAFLSNPAARYEYWRQKAIAHQDFHGRQPNSGHIVLARWEQRGLLRAVITQNIDGLHQEAGSHHVTELHGTARAVICLDCHARFDADPMVQQFLQEDAVPACPKCKTGRLKHATISFGQPLDLETLRTASELSQAADLVLALGSSLVVEPAASLPRVAMRNGARLVIINRDSTPLDDGADVVIHDSIGPTLAAIAARIEDA